MQIESLLTDFGCHFEAKKLVIVTDSGSNMIKAYRDLQELHCENPILYTAVEHEAVNGVTLLYFISTSNKKAVIRKSNNAKSLISVALILSEPLRLYSFVHGVHDCTLDLVKQQCYIDKHLCLYEKP